MRLNTPKETLSGKRARTREQILDAAVACFAASGIRQCNMIDIAERAGVGRSTLYRHFASIDDLIVQAIIRDLHDVIARAGAMADRFPALEDKIVESFVLILHELPRRPVLNMLFRQDAELVHHLSLEAEAFNRLGAHFAAPVYEQAWREGRLREGVSLDEYVEWTTRILLSLAGNPYEHRDDSERMHLYLRRFLLPSVLTGL